MTNQKWILLMMLIGAILFLLGYHIGRNESAFVDEYEKIEDDKNDKIGGGYEER